MKSARDGDRTDAEARPEEDDVVEAERLDDLVAKHRGRIDTGGEARQDLEAMRGEWR
jgi:hypothetical protein